MSDCLHCDIHEMLESHPQAQQADLADIAAKVTEVLADLILMAPPDEQTLMPNRAGSSARTDLKRQANPSKTPCRIRSPNWGISLIFIGRISGLRMSFRAFHRSGDKLRHLEPKLAPRNGLPDWRKRPLSSGSENRVDREGQR
jgi:hypothetical protein